MLRRRSLNKKVGNFIVIMFANFLNLTIPRELAKLWLIRGGFVENLSQT
jgi:hypothetical protein